MKPSREFFRHTTLALALLAVFLLLLLFPAQHSPECLRQPTPMDN